ncbi:MAG: FlgD immunoglobulin-like domain containing protein [candidate division WOR-3 bacterium]
MAYNDDRDQLWIMNIETEERRKVTKDDKGYCGPRWSPDSKKLLFSSLDGGTKVVDITNNESYDLGPSEGAKWSPDGLFIIYSVKEGKNWDIYVRKYDGSEKYRITSTPNISELHPSFSPDGKMIVYHTYGDREIFIAYLGNDYTIDSVRLIRKEREELKVRYREDKGPIEGKYIDVPYIHQLYDTPDWFNGDWACAPTTAMMAIAYYKKLPRWDCSCSQPYSHISKWGRYICEQYNYRGITYRDSAQDPWGNWAKGGYGYMWSSGNRPYNRMHIYHQNHGLTSWRTDNPSWDNVKNELDLNYPYALCCSLTQSGHLILAVGYVPGTRTLICNDPYGNKNTPPWPNYNGKDVRYDWPWYNGGYVNLRVVYYAVGARGTMPPAPDTIVDDLSFSDTIVNPGFYIYNLPPATMRWWWDAMIGYQGHMWWTYTNPSTTQDTCYAIWRPVLPQSGNYEVFAYIPSNYANATSARYKIYYSGGSQTVIIDQSQYSDVWVSLGTYPFSAGSSGYVRLGDATGVAGQWLGFDAVKWSYRNVRDVGCTDIYAPSGTIDSGTTITPQARVYNYGNTTESYSVRMKVGTFYNQTVSVSNHSPGTYQTVNFPSYSAWPRGTHTVSCSTELAADMNRGNDKRAGSVSVRVSDVGVVSILAPSGTIDSGMIVTPRVKAKNFGNSSASFPVWFRIHSTDYLPISKTKFLSEVLPFEIQKSETGKFDQIYEDSLWLTLLPGDSTVRDFRPWIAIPDTYRLVSFTVLSGDMNIRNDTAYSSVIVRRPIHDVGAIRILVPTGEIDSGTIVTPKALVQNFGTASENFPVRFTIGGFYTDDTIIILAAGRVDTVEFIPWTANQIGSHMTKCTTLLNGDINPANDFVKDSVRVVPFVVIAEPNFVFSTPEFFILEDNFPNPFISKTFIQYGLPEDCYVSLRIYNASGMLVRTLKIGREKAGFHKVIWDGCDEEGKKVPKGIYFYYIKAGEFIEMRKMVKAE